jgi:C4-dicarboxylate-specific signal transduction histidine kinase
MLSEGDRCSLASALGEPMLAQLSELAHDLRVSTMGEMVAGLAHELNQPLYAITNYARSCENLLREHADLHAEFSNIANKLVSQATRAADIVRRLRRFVSRREPRRTRLDVNALVQEVEQLMLFHAKRFSIPMHVRLGQDLPPVFADSLLIEQVLVNLLRNAFEAINDNNLTGLASVSMRTARLGDDAIEIVVSDSGPGFGDAPLEQLFEAFFTTKASGMGLGLVISRSIVQAHGGSLTASQHPEGGAVFRMTLPMFVEDV